MSAKPPFGPVSTETAPNIHPAAFAEAHRKLTEDGAIQFSLPMYEPPRPTPPPAWLEWLANFLSAEHPVLRTLLWGMVAAAALLILWLVIRRLNGSGWPWRRRARDDRAGESWRPAEAPARALLGEADALAGRGLFSDAIRLLLFRSIADLEERRPGLVTPALTSRDIAGLPDIPSGPRGAFARIAMLVERGLFARRPLAESDWRDCRAAYEEFAFADEWRG
ncbi:hypothetical protein [Sphingosinicella sp. CPCC 101087]|uniref:hypothetical protein n=1 Tax=Sphingosinicella sp. CPCC 101087 TaxID=2497754 RepID=UPI00101B62FC|nr:hypothetical protein [Sphingosinicella sp. CPCC 101087]